MARHLLIAGALLLAAATPALAQEVPADRSQDLRWQNAQTLALATRSSAQGWRVLEGGLRWRRVKGDGSGAHPAVSDMVTLHYAGTFVDGSEFDSSYGGPPAHFPLDRLIRAWQIAVPLMGVGDTIEIAVPAELGYGFRSKGPIPGGATLLFKIELIGIGG
jgi:FKBP-type peptidyl-prolyl cis-trans isomerase